jgi:hypothetical protein
MAKLRLTIRKPINPIRGRALAVFGNTEAVCTNCEGGASNTPTKFR